MTEKEKMLAGVLYVSADPELVRDRLRSKMICNKLNTLTPDKITERKTLINELFLVDTDCYIEPVFYCDYGYNIKLGRNVYMNHNCVILDVNTVTIGDNVMIAPNVQIYTATHPLNPIERNSGKEYGFPIVIGNNVWIGGNSVIGPGVTIGDNVVIGAGSVVTKSIEANMVVAGVPAKVIRKLDL
ncbi:MAG: sugar O-acetyltransferase [Bacilli bacterium]|nr:sugar O-acetyltransferase [Bacilli bacterium]